jgi:hypothetical protein
LEGEQQPLSTGINGGQEPHRAFRNIPLVRLFEFHDDVEQPCLQTKKMAGIEDTLGSLSADYWHRDHLQSRAR